MKEASSYLVLVNKPVGITSRDVVNKLNHILTTKKIGHTGTLDPLASGVLVCLVGKYTKLGELITSLDKEYVAKIKLGIKTDTGDITGNTLETSSYKPSRKLVEKVFSEFPKKYMQTVPKYSAVKINGKKLYEYARENIDIKLPEREVTIYNLELLSYENDTITFKAKVSKGTYIRALIEDICDRINCLGTMSALEWTMQGKFKLENSFTLEDIENGEFIFQKIADFLDIPVYSIPKTYLTKVLNGAKLPDIFSLSNLVLLTDKGEEVAIYQKENDYLRPYIMLK